MVNGREIFIDKSVEWMMKDLRSWLGKHMQTNQEALLTWMTLTLNEKKKAWVGRGQKKASDHVNGKIKMLADTKVFYSTVLTDEVTK
eukprot:scaffold13947_cov38-Attheya_sp.AAC.3